MTDKRQNVRRLQVSTFSFWLFNLKIEIQDCHLSWQDNVLPRFRLKMLVAGSEERAERQGANASRGAPAPSGAVQLRRRGDQIHSVALNSVFASCRNTHAQVVKPMDKKKVLVKVHPEGKFVVDVDKNIDINDVTPNCR